MTTENLPMELPRCSRHGLFMAHRDLTNRPLEAWCGIWFDCTDPHCKNSVLLESHELRAQAQALHPRNGASI